MGAVDTPGRRSVEDGDTPVEHGSRGNRATRSGVRPAILGMVAVLLLALSMRIPTTSLGPLLPEVQSGTGHGETFLSLLTTIPLALTLAVAPVTPRIALRFGRDRVLCAALALIVIGTVLRSLPGDVWLLAGTGVLGVAIAVGTVLAPAAIAAERADRRATLTSVYSMALSLGPALALGLTVPMMYGTGLTWRGTLMLWAVCTVFALGAWMLYSRPADATTDATPRPGRTADPVPGDDARSDASDSRARLAVADLRVWQLAVYLGITSLTFYTSSTWLPTTFVLDGMEAGTAGGYVSLINLVAIPFALLSPILMRRGLSRILSPLAPLIAAAGLGVLLAVGSSGTLVVAILMGISQGLCLGVAYGQIVQFATSPDHASSVSAVTSAVGIALAAIGPLAFGSALEASGTWLPSVAGLGAAVLIQTLVGVRTGRFVAARA